MPDHRRRPLQSSPDRFPVAATQTSDAGQAGQLEHDKQNDNTLRENPAEEKQPREIGGRQGPDPTRFGDWEKNGRCIDF